MYVVAIAYGFVVALMAAAEAIETSVVAGLLTFVFYGVFPLSIVIYLSAAAQRKREQKKRIENLRGGGTPGRAEEANDSVAD